MRILCKEPWFARHTQRVIPPPPTSAALIDGSTEGRKGGGGEGALTGPGATGVSALYDSDVGLRVFTAM
jgi:hypothetical protein